MKEFSYLAAGSNPRFEGTAEKLRFSVPRCLRRRAAPQAKRYANRKESGWIF